MKNDIITLPKSLDKAPKKSKHFVVYSQKLAGYLMYNGFKLVNIQPNKEFPQFNVFIFLNTDELAKAVDTFKTMEKEEN